MFRASVCLRGQSGVGDRIPRRHFRRDVDRSVNTEALLQSLVNHEQRGIPDGAGAKGNEGFDLVGQCLLSQPGAANLVRLYDCLHAGCHACSAVRSWSTAEPVASRAYRWY